MSAVALRGQKTVSDQVMLELMAVVNNTIWMLESKLGHSARAVYTLNHRTNHLLSSSLFAPKLMVYSR